MFTSSAARRGLFLALASLTGCLDGDTAAPAAPAPADRIDALVAAGTLELDLDAAAGDPTVAADARELMTRTLDQAIGLDLAGGHRMAIRYLGKGRLGGEPTAGAPRPTDDGAPALTGFDAFNPATQNQFRVELPNGGLAAVGTAAHALGLDQGSVSAEERALARSWSNGDDDRFRMYGLNAAVTGASHKPLVRIGSGCSGTLVGPRHMVTAGHCLYNRDTDTWSNNFWVRAGRNGSSSVAQVFVDSDDIPAGQSLWYFTPAQFRAETGSTWGYDFGILVLPGRIGETAGWFGRVAMTSTTLASQDIFRRGYPMCDVANRTDDPVACDDHHLYGNAALCEFGEYESVDGDGWSRIVHHSCDASAGDSGSSLYVFFNGIPSVAAIHTTSRCGSSPTDNACVGTQVDRPLAATRLTPEYRDWISYFLELFP